MSCLHFNYFALDAGLLARSQYSEGPATGHLDAGFSWFPYALKQVLSDSQCSKLPLYASHICPPDLNLVVTNIIFCIHVK